MSKSSKQSKDVSRWLEAPDLALLELVQEAANSTYHPRPSLVLGARATLSIVDTVQDAQDIAPEVQLLVQHAVRVVGLLCRVYPKAANGSNVGQIVQDLAVLLPEILNHVNTTRFLHRNRTKVYVDELQTTIMKVTSLIARQETRTRRVPAMRQEEEEEDQLESEEKLSEIQNEAEDHLSARCKMKDKSRKMADRTRLISELYGTNRDPTTSRIAPHPNPVHHAAGALPYSTGYSPPLFPCAAGHIFIPAPSVLPSFPTPGGTYFVPYCSPPPSLSNQQNIYVTSNTQHLGGGKRSTLLRCILSWKRRKLFTYDHLDLLRAAAQSAPSLFLKAVVDAALQIALHRSTGIASVLAEEAIVTAAVLWTSYQQAPDPCIWERATTKVVEKVAIVLHDILESIRLQADSSLVASLLQWNPRRRRMEAHRTVLQSTLVQIALCHIDLHEVSFCPPEEREYAVSQITARGRPRTVEESEDDVEAADTKRTRLDGQLKEGPHKVRQEIGPTAAQRKGKARQVDTDSSTATAPEHERIPIYPEFSGSTSSVNAGGSSEQGPSTSYPPYPRPYPPYSTSSQYQYLPGPSSYSGPSFYSGLPFPHYLSSSPSGMYGPSLSPATTSKQNSGTSLSMGLTNVDSERSRRRGGRRSKKTKDST